MDRILFYIVLPVFSLIEIYILYKFIKSKSKKYFNATLTSFLLFVVYYIADIVFRIGVSYWLLILVVISIYVQTYFGYYKDMFLRSKVFDRYHHAYAAFAFALFINAVLQSLLKPSVSPRLYSALFVAALGIALGAVFEIIEFLIDKKMKTKTQTNLKDTDFDLIFDCFGAVLAGIAYFFIQ